ncbi:MAG: SOS response-associated peptidase [Planctomycetes bacterium]|nr:SOS response-associated peptidase [Planctomycetota bacterium]
MCSNYRAPTDMGRMQRHFAAALDLPPPPGETWPLDRAAVVRAADGPGTARDATLGQFGLLPHWAKEPSFGRSTYNARSETAATKPSFRDAWRKGQRCVVPADWIYEPCWETGKAVRWRIARADGAPLAIAGLWSRWQPTQGEPVVTFTMLTVNADGHELMQRFHKPGDERRMVVVLEGDEIDGWLTAPAAMMAAWMRRCPAERLVAAADPLPPRPRATS